LARWPTLICATPSSQARITCSVGGQKTEEYAVGRWQAGPVHSRAPASVIGRVPHTTSLRVKNPERPNLWRAGPRNANKVSMSTTPRSPRSHQPAERTYATLANLKAERLTAVPGAVKLVPVGQRPRVVHLHGGARRRAAAVPGGDGLDLDTHGGGGRQRKCGKGGGGRSARSGWRKWATSKLAGGAGPGLTLSSS